MGDTKTKLDQPPVDCGREMKINGEHFLKPMWRAMIHRCHNPKSHKYKSYGDRGITVCDRWRGVGGFDAFIGDMGLPPFPDAQVDRKDNDGPYSPENCCWATRSQQARHRRDSRFVVYCGKRVLLIDLAESKKITYKLAWKRIFTFGWDVERAVDTPTGNHVPAGKGTSRKAIKRRECKGDK